MLVSILHRATGTAMALGGGVMLASWLTALASGEESYARYIDLMTSDEGGRLNLVPAVILIGLTWSFLQHLCSGVRHLILDTGAGYELRANRRGAMLPFVISILLTALVWGGIYGGVL